MGEKTKSSYDQVRGIIIEIAYDLHTLYDSSWDKSRNCLFYKVLNNLQELQQLCCNPHVTYAREEDIKRVNDPNENEKIFLTMEQLANYDGREGSPAYVAVNGIIYDISHIPQWAQGVHFGVSAGQDVTERVKLCHGGGVLSLLKVVGRII